MLVMNPMTPPITIKHLTSGAFWSGAAATLSSVVFALALICIVWLQGDRQLGESRELMRTELALKAENLAVAFEHNVAITANDLDQLLIFLRQSRYRIGDKLPWQELVREPFTIAEQAVQIAVIEKSGQMLTSTAMLYPKEPVDLSDREHFKHHAQTDGDDLFICKPMIGRASRKISVQFARRLEQENGSFDGVIVVSLDPEYVTKTYSKLNLGKTGGLSLNGGDGIVRAGTGRFSPTVGILYREDQFVQNLVARDPDTRLELQRFDDGLKVVAKRHVSDFPLEVVDVEAATTWTDAQRVYVAWSSGITVLILLVLCVAISWQRQTDGVLRQLAQKDSLTGLANRLSFQAHLTTALEATETQTEGVVLLIVDLDGFKPINDTYGHPTGDRLLTAVAERMTKSIRSTDFLARLGGDEFAIIQHGIRTDDDAAALAERICEDMAKPFEIDKRTMSIGASVGIARYPGDANTSIDLVTAADLALYSAKALGGSISQRYSLAVSQSVQESRKLERDLRNALRNDELTLHYQPIASVSSREIVGFEALLRWQHAERGFVSPMEFIPIAERCGVIDEIGAWVIDQACQDAMTLPPSLSVSVNCSPVQFIRKTLPHSIASSLARSGMAAHRLKLEITETTLMRHDVATWEQLNDITRMGVMLTMDDFGTGYSSLSYLQSYPFTCIKIDRSFIKALDNSDSKPVILKAIVGMASSLEMSTTAEGIETEEQLQLVASIGCTHAQGYLFAKPGPLAEARRLVEKLSLSVAA